MMSLFRSDLPRRHSLDVLPPQGAARMPRGDFSRPAVPDCMGEKWKSDLLTRRNRSSGVMAGNWFAANGGVFADVIAAPDG